MPSDKVAKGGRRPNDLGPTGVRLAQTVRTLREERGLSWTELSQRLAGLGRQIPALSLRRIEEGAEVRKPDSRARRVDADDLVALAIALEVTPNRLLLGVEEVDEFEDIALTASYTTAFAVAWRWAQARTSLPTDPDIEITDTKRDLMAFLVRSLPTFMIDELLQDLPEALKNQMTKPLEEGESTRRRLSDDGSFRSPKGARRGKR